MKATLILENGSIFEGQSIGSTEDCVCEMVFNTSMVGYQEILTDPSYAGQLMTLGERHLSFATSPGGAVISAAKVIWTII